MIITGKDLKHIIELAAFNSRSRNINAYKLDDMDLLFAVPIRHLMESFKSYELGSALGFVDKASETYKTIPTKIVTYSLWGYDTENGAFVFKKDTK